MPPQSDPPELNASGLEIERTYLLDRLPDLPPDAMVYRLEQGYLPDPSTAHEDNPVEGRLRRTVKADGSVIYTHTIKRGMGLVRQETERTIGQQEFDNLWPRTAGRWKSTLNSDASGWKPTRRSNGSESPAPLRTSMSPIWRKPSVTIGIRIALRSSLWIPLR